jgi:hypothetical protein
VLQLSQDTGCTCAVPYTVSKHLLLHPSIQICSTFRQVARSSMFTISAAWVRRKRKKPDLYPHQMNMKLHSWMQIGKEHAPETSSSSFLLHWLGSDAQSLPLTSEPKKNSRCSIQTPHSTGSRATLVQSARYCLRPRNEPHQSLWSRIPLIKLEICRLDKVFASFRRIIPLIILFTRPLHWNFRRS